MGINKQPDKFVSEISKTVYMNQSAKCSIPIEKRVVRYNPACLIGINFYFTQIFY